MASQRAGGTMTRLRIVLVGGKRWRVGNVRALHLGIAFSVSHLLTGDVAVAEAITLVEPVANTVAHFFFDRWWASRRTAAPAGAAS